MMRLRDRKNVQRMTIGLVACIAGALAAALKVSGCGWGYYTDHSVRFSGYREATEFARLPRLPDFSRLNQNRLFSWDEDVGDEEVNYEKPKSAGRFANFSTSRVVSAKKNGGLRRAFRRDAIRPSIYSTR